MPRRRDDDWFFSIGAELHRLSDEVLRGGVSPTRSKQSWRPNIDVTENAAEILVTVELAGVDPDSVSLHFSPQASSLTIRGMRVPKAHDDMRSRQLEIFYGEFERMVPLKGALLDRDRIRASMEHGFLCIAVPKRKQIIERRIIHITEDNGGS